MEKKRAIIIGAGPAGLTAAFELLEKSDILPVIFEASSDIGGISKTVNYKGNRIDIGGHRFFSKSDIVMNWWQNILPVLDPEIKDDVMLIRSRLSRILFLRKFFDYPISLNTQTIRNLGSIRIAKIGCSYIKASLFPIKPEKNLEDFFINRFGKELYNTFFKDYTEKVWGVPCTQIKPDWGAQRIKGLSITKAILHFFRKTNETSLIDKFLYPKFGPGQMWEKVAEIVSDKGGQVLLNHKVIKLKTEDGKVTQVTAQITVTGETTTLNCDYCISTMPIRDLIDSLQTEVPDDVKNVANGLVYRDFKTVGLLLHKLKVDMPDNWVYIQERDVKVGRLQVFNNWSPYMVDDPNKIWLGLEYFCNEGDELWTMPDNEFIEFAKDELQKIDIIDKKDVVDAVVIAMPKAYPAYFGTYDNLKTVKDFVDKIPNLYLIGRNGMHKYNNMDHSMLSAMQTVYNIINNVNTRDNIWNVNAEEVYQEEK
ncbi:MAG: hypothetical protein A2Y25_05440 [Candidatus Melainabacteria bacterium GWF2_37_15]|nr:MAG: hypothetical protein A2Y25_05440 [Candidatus Melainabacteria bacterium GWF2_37_15]